MRTFSSRVDAWPCSSKAMTTAAAPYLRTSLARLRNSSSPSLSEIEFTMLFPWTHFRPASSTLHFEESIITGTRDISGSAAIRFRNLTIVGSPSMSASSTLMSMTLAPLSTCWRAMARHASQSPDLRALANLGEPVMFVRSPITMNCEAEGRGALVIGRRPASGDDEPLEAAQAHGGRVALRPARGERAHGRRDGGYVRGCRPAASADHVDPAVLREVPEHSGHVRRRLVIPAEGVRKPGVRVAGGVAGG